MISSNYVFKILHRSIPKSQQRSQIVLDPFNLLTLVFVILFALNANIYFVPFGSLLNFANLPGKGAFCGGIRVSKVLKLSPFRASCCGSVGRAVAPIPKVRSSNPAISKNNIERLSTVLKG